jgi:Uma2 family endonuclease
MPTAILPPPAGPKAPPPPTVWRPQPKRWTLAEFHLLGDSGLLEGQNVFLVNGEILEMPAAGAAHDVALSLLDDLIRRCFPTGFTVRCQMSLVLGQSLDLVPDLAVARGSARTFLQKPTTGELVVEVSDTSLVYDLGDKASLYASAGIADYWVVDLVHRQLLVMRDPVADATRAFGFGYATVTTYAVGQGASPLAAPAATVAVADLMP